MRWWSETGVLEANMAAFRVGGLVGFGFGPSGVRWVVWAFGNFGFGRLELVTHPDNAVGR